MKKLKIAVIGSGSTYTPELVDGFLRRKGSLPVGELVLMDIDKRKLEIVGGLCERMIRSAGLGCRVVLTEDLDTALTGADFVMAQIRVGKLAARVKDERIPLKYDLIGQETCGIGGFFKALRTIPAMLHVAERMESLCPCAWLINFSNPSGILTHALCNHSKIRMIGLCNVPYNMKKSIREGMQLEQAEIEYIGLNHLSWITAIRHDGRNYLKEAIDRGLQGGTMKNIPAGGFPAELLRTVGAIPSSYLEYYYYKDKKLKILKESKQTRGEICMGIEEELLRIYSDSTIHTKPAQLDSRGGANYSEAAVSLVDAIYNDRREIHTVNMLNGDALDFMEPGDSVEINAVVGKDGPVPVKITGFNNRHIIDYMRMLKSYERETVNAAVYGDDDAAIRALLINPLVGDYHLATECYQEMKEAHRDFLPQFFK